MAKKTKTTTKKLVSKKTKSVKPLPPPALEDIANDAKKFWQKFENDLHTDSTKYGKHDKKFPLDYHNVQFQGYFKNLHKDCTKDFDSIDLLADDRPWIVKAWSKVYGAYKSAADYAWENPIKTFFIIAGIVFTISTVSSCIHRL